MCMRDRLHTTFPILSWKSIHLSDTDYVPKWMEEIVFPSNDTKVVMKFIRKHIFTKFVTLRAINNDGDTHFINSLVRNLLSIYRVGHKEATTYHPQISE